MSGEPSDNHCNGKEEREEASPKAENDSHAANEFNKCKEVSEECRQWEGHATEHSGDHFDVADFHVAGGDENSTKDEACKEKSEVVHPRSFNETFSHFI